jgi:hypothetical protein
MRIRIYKTGDLPMTLEHRGLKLSVNTLATVRSIIENKNTVLKDLKAQGKCIALVEVHNKKLKGCTDLHGRPYKPNTFIFTD